MKSIEAFFSRERKRLRFYSLVSLLFQSLSIFGAAFLLFKCILYALPAFKISFELISLLTLGSLPLAAGLSTIFLVLAFRKIKPYPLAEVGRRLELESDSFNRKKNAGELRSAGYFLDSVTNDGESSELRDAHIQYWNKRILKIARPLRPSPMILMSYAVFFLVVVSASMLFSPFNYNLPSNILEWTPGSFEIRGPYDGAPWEHQTGALSGIQGSSVRFEAPSFGWLRTYFYVKESGQDWKIISCAETCDWQLRERGQYAVGTLFSRSSVFPLQVIPDEAPRSLLFVNVNGEFLPSATVEAKNIEKLQMQVTASDDIRIVKVELHHRLSQGDVDDKIIEWTVNDSHFKKDFVLPLAGWKGGQHQVYLKVFDQFKSADSSPVTILFADEETLRAKRIADMRALIDEWVHVLADLLDTQADHILSEQLVKRLQGIQYPDTTDAPLMSAFVKELSALGSRIQNWAKFSPDFSQVGDLIARTERTLLYGLSLVFQEKTGEIEATSDSLKKSQNQLSSLLDKIKNGELSASSEELQEAFKKLAEQLAELQKKIRELPTGPADDMINREALDAQVEESDNLAKRIEEIKKQMAAGDNKGAMRELESLLNQLSILSKEMERSLDQWKSNLDQGAVQSAKRFQKKLEDLKKQQEELAKKTETTKEKAQKLEAQNSKTWKPIQPDKIENLQKEFNDLRKQQEKIGEEFKKSTEDFDREMQGTEFESMLRSQETKSTEEQITDRMTNARDSLVQRKGFDALSNQKEAIELMKKLSESQQQMQQQLESASQRQGQNKEPREKVEILATETKTEKERRRKIMESMQHKVDERYQKSHEQYFEEMLQR